MDTFITQLNAFMKKPFDPNGNALNWVFFLLFIITLNFAWSRVLKHITE